jgi:hypothetical protein
LAGRRGRRRPARAGRRVGSPAGRPPRAPPVMSHGRAGDDTATRMRDTQFEGCPVQHVCGTNRRGGTYLPCRCGAPYAGRYHTRQRRSARAPVTARRVARLASPPAAATHWTPDSGPSHAPRPAVSQGRSVLSHLPFERFQASHVPFDAQRPPVVAVHGDRAGRLPRLHLQSLARGHHPLLHR